MWLLLANVKQFKYLYLIGLYLITILSFTSYYYYSQNKIKELKPYKDSYNSLVIKYNTDIKYLKEVHNKQLDAERSGFDSYKKQCNALQKLDSVSKVAPTKVEKLINKASKNRIDCFAAATGNKDKANDLCKTYSKQ